MSSRNCRRGARIGKCWERWVDSLFADPPAPECGPAAVQRPEPPVCPKLTWAGRWFSSIDALIARYTADGLSQREIARRLNVGKGTVQRRQYAQRELVQV